ncbi:phosphoglycolate phosphatase [Thalassotalea insulae]|uniref:Phosphoglycolate phosphatase n=1 Tax=Thalassotalea insulae TaxID=2056778 RepID=A0ABQ6GLK1_9GAMM|nr:HAD-IA family hydrolase [Thalassotalea insulae]GLX76812.1 phosphoglycolate phosphatase [Thalassotalea insulae]
MSQEPSNIAAVLFDLDGTLLDTADDLGAALNHVLAGHNLPEIEREIFRPVASDGAKGLLELGFGQRLKNYDYDVLRERFLSYYQSHIAIKTCLYPGISSLLNTLNQNDIPWGIVTNKPEQLTKQLLPHYVEFEQCRVIVGGDTLSTRKPDPAPLLFACQRLEASPEHCLYIGDAQRDIEAGNRAKMTTVVAAWGYIKTSDDINQWQADYIAKSIKDCLMYI